MSQNDKYLIEKGWAMMHERLDLEMPVARKKRRFLWIWLLGLIVFLGVFIFVKSRIFQPIDTMNPSLHTETAQTSFQDSTNEEMTFKGINQSHQDDSIAISPTSSHEVQSHMVTSPQIMQSSTVKIGETASSPLRNTDNVPHINSENSNIVEKINKNETRDMLLKDQESQSEAADLASNERSTLEAMPTIPESKPVLNMAKFFPTLSEDVKFDSKPKFIPYVGIGYGLAKNKIHGPELFGGVNYDLIPKLTIGIQSRIMFTKSRQALDLSISDSSAAINVEQSAEIRNTLKNKATENTFGVQFSTLVQYNFLPRWSLFGGPQIQMQTTQGYDQSLSYGVTGGVGFILNPHVETSLKYNHIQSFPFPTLQMSVMYILK